MDELGLEFFSTEKQKEIIDKMPLSERAQIECWPEYLSTQGINRFPDYLSIKDVCDLLFPIPDNELKPTDKSLYSEWRDKKKFQANKKKGFKEFLIDACANGGLLYQGDIKGWHYYCNNPHPLAKNGRTRAYIPGEPCDHALYCLPEDCTMHKHDFKQYMQSIEKWIAVNQGSLAKWWSDDTKSNQTENISPETNATQVELGAKKHPNRVTKFTDLVWRVYLYLLNNNKKHTAQSVWNEIEHRHAYHDKHKIIQEVTSDCIYWNSSYSKEPKFERKSLDSKLVRLKKDPPF